METSPTQKSTIVSAWVIVLGASSLPKIILQEIFHYTVSADLQAIIAAGVVVLAILLSLVWKPLQPLRPFLGLFLVLVGVEWLVYNKVGLLTIYQKWLNNPSFNVYMLAQQSLRLLVSLAIIATLFIIKRKRESFFLVIGNLSAPMEPVKWLGIKPGDTWKKFGRVFSFFISLGTLVFLVSAARPQLDFVLKALPFLPAVLLAAVLNAFNEEMTYKASFLSVLEDRVGGKQALMLMAAFFGLGHYYGIPYGVIGVLMAGFLGWLLGKSMLETRGFFWAWFIHFLQDVLIFSFLAIGSVTPGGG